MSIRPEQLLDHADFVHALARSLVLDDHKAADIAQRTWLAALESPPPRKISLRGWLAKVTRNFARMLHREERLREKYERQAPVPEGFTSPEEAVARGEARRRLIDAVLHLEEPYCTAILLRYFDDLPPKEIAKQQNIPSDTVKTRLKKGRELCG